LQIPTVVDALLKEMDDREITVASMIKSRATAPVT
jgi:hypothetical protein